MNKKSIKKVHSNKANKIKWDFMLFSNSLQFLQKKSQTWGCLESQIQEWKWSKMMLTKTSIRLKVVSNRPQLIP